MKGHRWASRTGTMLALTAAIVAHAGRASGQPVEGARTPSGQTEGVEEWVRRTMTGFEALTARDGGVVVVWDEIESTLMTPAEIDAQWKAVAPFPDHPKRIGLERHRTLAKEAMRTRYQATYAGDGAWSLTQSVPKCEAWPEGMELRAGGTEDRRWIWFSSKSTGQLTVIHSGVAYPSGYDASRYLGRLKDEVGKILFYNLPAWSADSSVAVSKADEGTWRVVVEQKDVFSTLTLNGRWLVPGTQAAVLSMSQRSTAGSGAVRGSWRFDDFRSEDAAGRVVPHKMTSDSESRIRTVVTLVEVRRVSAGEAAAAGEVPDPPPGGRVLDFSGPESPAWANSPRDRAVWTRAGGQDRFEMISAPVTPISEPLAPPGSGGWGWQRRTALAGLVVVVGVPLAILAAKRFRRT